MAPSAFDELVFGWRTAILAVMAAQLLICAGLLFVRGVEQPANRLLAALLAVIAGVLTPQMIGFAGFYDAFPWLSFAPLSNDLWIGPLIYAYIGVLTVGRLPWPGRWMFAPGAVALAYETFWFLQPLERKWGWVRAVHDPYIAPTITFFSIVFAVAGLALAARRVRGYRRWLDAASSARATFDLRGVITILAMLAAPIAAWVAMDLIEALGGPLSYRQEYPFYVLLAGAAVALGAAALAQPAETFPKMTPAAPPADPAPKDDAPDWAGIAAELRDAVTAEAWFREARLSLGQVADRTGLGEFYVSRAVNLGAGVNFNTFINQIRIQAVKRELAAGAEDVLAAALDCGFNSKATFNRVFRELTGETPSAYRARAAG